MFISFVQLIKIIGQSRVWCQGTPCFGGKASYSCKCWNYLRSRNGWIAWQGTRIDWVDWRWINKWRTKRSSGKSWHRAGDKNNMFKSNITPTKNHYYLKFTSWETYTAQLLVSVSSNHLDRMMQISSVLFYLYIVALTLYQRTFQTSQTPTMLRNHLARSSSCKQHSCDSCLRGLRGICRISRIHDLCSPICPLSHLPLEEFFFWYSQWHVR